MYTFEHKPRKHPPPLTARNKELFAQPHQVLIVLVGHSNCNDPDNHRNDEAWYRDQPRERTCKSFDEVTRKDRDSKKSLDQRASLVLRWPFRDLACRNPSLRLHRVPCWNKTR